MQSANPHGVAVCLPREVKTAMRAIDFLDPFPIRRAKWGFATVIAATVACASGNVNVNTQVAPEANFGSYHTFQVMSPRGRRSGNPASQADPMLNNSITNRAMRSEIQQRLEALGYQAGGG